MTKSALGIDNVDNTSDADKPISTAAETALAGKVDKETNKSLMTADEHTKLSGIETGAQVNTVTGVKGSNEAEYRTGNVSITKGNVGLGNVDNTADADKPISTAAQTALDGKVDKITGKGLSEANFTDAEKTKLAGIATGAEVNVQSDWNQGNDAADDYIKNKPSNLVQDASYVHTDNNFTNAEKAKADGAIQSTEKGTAGGVAELDEYGHVPVSQLPSFVSDVIDGYYDSETTHKFYADAQHQTEIQGQSNKIYVDVNTNLSYRWSGSVFAEVSPSLALGSTDSTAYRGDWGTADHAAIGVLASLNTSEKSSLVAAINELQSGSVSVDPDRGLSENDFTDSLKSKLDGIESGAEVNVQSDWNQTVTTADDFIKNKPENLVQDASYVHTDNNYTTGEKTKLAGISAGAQVNTVTGVKGNAENDYRTGDINISPANIGLGNVNNTSDANKPISTATQTALNAKQDALTAGDNVSIATVNGVLTISATDTTYSDATQQTHGLMSTADKTKLDGIQTGAAAVSVTQTLASGTKIGTVTVNGTGTDLYCETNTDTTYSAGSGISISNGEISNSAPNVQADWNASGTAAEILNKPTIPNYSNATTSKAGLMSATDKSALNAINAGTQVSLMSGSIDLVSASNNRTALSSAVSNFRAIEIRYAMYPGATSYTNIIRAVNKDGQGDYGNIAALVVRADTAGSLSLYMCNLQLSGSNLTLSAVNNIPSFYVYNVWGYK